jgi:tetratricopeptide (TPR) repeat protein
MKSQIRSILFALILPACGGERETPTVASNSNDQLAKPVQVSAPVPVPKAAEPVKVVLDEQPLPTPPTQFDDALAQGRAAAEKGDRPRAREMFEAAIKLDKTRAEPHIELARLFISTGDRGMAIAAAKKGVKLAPLSSQAWNTKGRAELARFSYDDAIEAFSKAVELNRDNIWAWNNLGFAELQLKKYEVAAEHFAEATNRKGATGYMFNNLGTALEHLDRLDEARAAFDAGGKLGSQEAMASRKRLEGVKSIAIANKDEVKSTKDTTYDTNEGEIDEDKQLENSQGSGSGSGQPVEVKSGGEEGSDASTPSSTM